MNDEQALAALNAKIAALNAAKNGVMEHRTQVDKGNWTSAAVTKANMDATKALATTGGVDIGSWDGTEAVDEAV